MTFDSNLLTIVAIAVAVLGVLATLVAPRLTREARVHAQVSSVDRIRQITEAGNLRIDIRHGDNVIAEPVFIVGGAVQNVGGRDIVASHFVDPVGVTAQGQLEILSLELTCPPGVTANVEAIDGGRGIRWNILKPKEKIKFLAVVKSTDGETSSKLIRRRVEVAARLRDVKSGFGLMSPDLRFGLTLAVILMTISVGPISYLGMRNVDAFLYKGPDGVSRILSPSDLGYKSCALKSGRIFFSQCNGIGPRSVDRLISTMSVSRVRIGISPVAIIVALVVSAVYGLAFAFGSRESLVVLKAAMQSALMDRDG